MGLNYASSLGLKISIFLIYLEFILSCVLYVQVRNIQSCSSLVLVEVVHPDPGDGWVGGDQLAGGRQGRRRAAGTAGQNSHHQAGEP